MVAMVSVMIIAGFREIRGSPNHHFISRKWEYCLCRPYTTRIQKNIPCPIMDRIPARTLSAMPMRNGIIPRVISSRTHHTFPPRKSILIRPGIIPIPGTRHMPSTRTTAPTRTGPGRERSQKKANVPMPDRSRRCRRTGSGLAGEKAVGGSKPGAALHSRTKRYQMIAGRHP